MPETPETTPLRTPADLATGLRMVIMRFGRRLRYERADDTLTLNQNTTLGTLHRRGPLALGTLAEHEHVQPPSMTRIVSALEERGLVRREPDPSDRRVVNVVLTEEGSARLAADRRRRTEWLTSRLRQLDPSERETLRAAIPVLEKLSLL